jgi:hypothetical protein
MDYISIQELIKAGNIKTAKQSLANASYQEKKTKQYSNLINLLEKQTSRLRKKFVKTNIKKIKGYIKNQELESAYNLINDLENIDSTNTKVIKLKSKIISKLNKKLQVSSKTLIDSSRREINKLIKENKDQEALELTYALVKLPTSLRKQVEQETRRKIIDNKILNNKIKLRKTPSPQKYDFIKNLYDLEPNYPYIQKLLLKSKKDLDKYSKIQKINLIDNLTQETKILFNKKQFNKAKVNAKRILSIDPDNSKGIKYYKKADDCYYKDSYKKAYKILQSKA